jgi:hypothetical protein
MPATRNASTGVGHPRIAAEFPLRNTGPMRMTFGEDDEDAYYRRRDELGEQFAQWLNTHGVAGDPNDAGLLMDWKRSYADGRLDHWSVPDVHEFLFDWCTRKLSAPPEDCAELPLSVAAFVEFLAHTGMLAPGSAAPPAIRKHCARNVDKFVREMGNPANFGMAKSLLGMAGGPELDLDSPNGMWQLDDAFEQMAEDTDPPVIAPVRLPPESERLAVVRAIPLMGQLRTLAEYCAPPGRKLTAKGNLQLADARHLVAALETGDDPELGGVRTLRSSEDLPGLCRLVDLALEAGVVRRQQGRLVAVGRFAALDECAAHEKVVLAALDADSTGPGSAFLRPVFAQLDAIVHMFTTALLAELLRHGATGVARDLVDGLTGDVVESIAEGMPDFMRGAVAMQAHEHLNHLVDLGVLTIDGGTATPCDDCGVSHHEGGTVAITAAGVPITIELLRQVGVEVSIRQEPADADVTAIVDLFEHLGDKELRRDVAEWFAAQPDRQAATAALAAESLAAHRNTVTAMVGITLLEELAADDAVELVRHHLEGPHDGLVLHWLIDKGVLDPESVDPARLMSGVIDFLAVGLDTAGPEEVVDAFSGGLPDGGVAVLDDLWRLDHPRLPDVLDAIGQHHPVKAVAKAARKALMKHKSRSTKA